MRKGNFESEYDKEGMIAFDKYDLQKTLEEILLMEFF